MIRVSILSILLVLFFTSCRNSNNNFETILPSPDSKKHLYFNLNDGEPYFLLYYEKHILVDWSRLGFVVDDSINLSDGLVFDNIVTRTSTQSEDDLFPVTDDGFSVFNEMIVYLAKPGNTHIQISVVLRIYDNAVAFKYIFNHLPGERKAKEITELDLHNNIFNKALISNTDLNEASFFELPLEDIDTLGFPATFISEEAFELEYMESISNKYPSMELIRRTPDRAEFKMIYSDDKIQNVQINKNFETPWRIIYITNNPI